MPRVWVATLLRLALLGTAGAVIGWLYGHLLLGLLIAVLLSLGWNLYWLYRLDRWLHGDPKPLIPDGVGVWPQVLAKIDYLHTRIKRRGKRFKSLVKQMNQATRSFPDGGIILNEQNEIVRMNDAAAKLLGLKRKQDRGLRITTLLRDPDFVGYVEKAAVNGETLEFVIPTDHAHNAQWRSCYIVPYGLDQKLLMIRDITQQRQVDKMRRDFVANASHELRTPLTVITGYLEALTEAEGIDPDLRMPVLEIERQAARMRALIEDLLKLSELDSKSRDGARNELDMAGLVAAAAQEARAMENCPQHVDIDLQSKARLLADECDIQSVLSNLVGNAVRYTPQDGRITISWRTDAKGGYLSVRDTGAGIAKEHIPRLTERFYRVESGRERVGGNRGTGLGLAIVKHALQRYGATLNIESKPGEGSEFSCHFPVERIVNIA
jgi:two-component system, OmpR family, phosphate regulon sensor histidine kinase PhoR